MYYNDAIGSFTNDFLEKILDTDLNYNVPYTFDRKKYTSIIEKYGLKTEIKTADTVFFNTDYNNDEETGNVGSRAFFVWPENSNDWHDVLFFGGYHELPLDEYETIVKEILGCVTGVDREYTEKLLEERLSEKDKVLGEIETLRTILKANEK